MRAEADEERRKQEDLLKEIQEKKDEERKAKEDKQKRKEERRKRKDEKKKLEADKKIRDDEEAKKKEKQNQNGFDVEPEERANSEPRPDYANDMNVNNIMPRRQKRNYFSDEENFDASFVINPTFKKPEPQKRTKPAPSYPKAPKPQVDQPMDRAQAPIKRKPPTTVPKTEPKLAPKSAPKPAPKPA